MVEFLGNQAPVHIRRAHTQAWNTIQQEYEGPFDREFLSAVRDFVYAVEESPYDFLVLQALKNLHRELRSIGARNNAVADVMQVENRYLDVLSDKLAQY